MQGRPFKPQKAAAEVHRYPFTQTSEGSVIYRALSLAKSVECKLLPAISQRHITHVQLVRDMRAPSALTDRPSHPYSMALDHDSPTKFIPSTSSPRCPRSWSSILTVWFGKRSSLTRTVALSILKHPRQARMGHSHCVKYTPNRVVSRLGYSSYSLLGYLPYVSGG